MIFVRCFYVSPFKAALSGLRQFVTAESPLKVIKYAFYFTSKALFVLKIFTLSSWIFSHVAKRLDKKDKIKGILIQIWQSANNFVFIWNNMLKISHWNAFLFWRYAHVRYVKILFTNIQKQWNMLKISLLFNKFTNFAGK